MRKICSLAQLDSRILEIAQNPYKNYLIQVNTYRIGRNPYILDYYNNSQSVTLLLDEYPSVVQSDLIHYLLHHLFLFYEEFLLSTFYHNLTLLLSEPKHP